MLSPPQVAYFKAFGFVVLRQLFTSEEAGIMMREAEEIFDEARDGAPNDGGETESIQPFLERGSFLSGLVDDDRIYNIGTALCGPDFVLEGTSGAVRVGDTPWHRDAPLENPLKNTQISFYPQPLARDTGCLRVVPGSHHLTSHDPLGVLRRENESADFRPFGVRPSEVPCYAFESQPGDVFVHTESIAHASFGGQAGRHQYSISFIADPTSEEQLSAIHGVYDVAKYMLHPAESYINSDKPRTRRMVSRLVELGFETSKV